jgi:protein O-GlcNAc transferase
VSRVTASHLSALDLHELIAHNDAHYIDIAVRVASDLSLLHEIRQGLRERMQQSALMDYQGFTHQLETKYREIWAHWCTVGDSRRGASG